jgi:hypothetical protein
MQTTHKRARLFSHLQPSAQLKNCLLMTNKMEMKRDHAMLDLDTRRLTLFGTISSQPGDVFCSECRERTYVQLFIGTFCDVIIITSDISKKNRARPSSTNMIFDGHWARLFPVYRQKKHTQERKDPQEQESVREFALTRERESETKKAVAQTRTTNA